jgi:hypothetical protein
MKRELIILISFLSLICINQNTQAQITKKQLNGTWQAESPDIGSGYGELYKFYLDGGFSYSPYQYDGLKRIISIKGTYEIKGKELLLTTTSTEEIVGGNLTRDPFITTNDSWAIKGGKLVEVKLNPVDHYLTIELNRDTTHSEPSILIDNRPFYRLN